MHLARSKKMIHKLLNDDIYQKLLRGQQSAGSKLDSKESVKDGLDFLEDSLDQVKEMTSMMPVAKKSLKARKASILEAESLCTLTERGSFNMEALPLEKNQLPSPIHSKRPRITETVGEIGDANQINEVGKRVCHIQQEGLKECSGDMGGLNRQQEVLSFTMGFDQKLSFGNNLMAMNSEPVDKIINPFALNDFRVKVQPLNLENLTNQIEDVNAPFSQSRYLESEDLLLTPLSKKISNFEQNIKML